MFSRLPISSNKLSAIRCKQCKQILFRQDSISQFISYNENDIGQLKQYANFPKLQTDGDYFVLEQQFTYFSSMKVIYDKSLIKSYHPFFKMHMFQVECAECKNLLGYVVETVNENTLWLEGRMLVDASGCALMKDGRDQMAKLVHLLRVRLERKFVLEQQEKENKKLNNKNDDQSNVNVNEKKQKDNDKQKQLKQQTMLRKLQKIHNQQRDKKDSEINKTKKSTEQKINKIEAINNQLQTAPQICQKKMQQSLQTTNISSSANMMILSKQDTNQIHQSANISNPIRGESKYDDIQRSNESYVSKVQNQQIKIISDDFLQTDFPNLQILPQHRQILITNLNNMRRNLISQSHLLQSQKLVQRILNSLNKLSQQQKYISGKVPGQLIKLNNLLTHIRLRFLERHTRMKGKSRL